MNCTKSLPSRLCSEGLGWCEKNRVDYIVGLAGNSRLEKLARPICDKALEAYRQTGEKQRLFAGISYAADTWKRKRRVIIKA